MPADLRRYATDVLLRDGTSMHVRAVQPDDGPRLREHFERLSDPSRYRRFFGAKRRLSDADLHGLLDLDYRDRMALAAVQGPDGAERIVGFAGWAVVERGDTGARAEVSFSVEDALQGHGIGTLLLEQLAALAHAGGVTEFEADVLGDNQKMLDVFAASGFGVTRSIDGGVFHLTFGTAETPTSASAHDARDQRAAGRSLAPVLAPRSVALVGASARPGSVGRALLRNLQGRFQGPLYLVNPHAELIDGAQVYPRVDAIGAPVDLAVIAVPAAGVESVVTDCARAGVRGVVVISAGFGETGPAGREVEHRLRALVRGAGMRLIGPNCLGALNTDPRIGLDATFAPTWPPAGNVAMLSQSGALGLAMLDQAQARGIGLSCFVSMGNKADVSSNDLLCWCHDDPRTRVVVLYLESVGNGRRFARIAPAVAREKPIVAVKSGRSAAGSRAASSHSAALASREVAVDALFEQAGVIRTATMEELLDVTALLATQPPPRGPRVGVVTNAGGPGILCADACEAHGLVLPTLDSATVTALRALLPPEAGLGNPVDVVATATTAQMAAAIRLVGADPNVDAVIAIYIPVLARNVDEMKAAIVSAAAGVPDTKPVLTVLMSSQGLPATASSGPRGALPCYRYPENAALALGAAQRWARWREQEPGNVISPPTMAERAVRAIVERIVRDAREPVWASPADCAALLRAVEIEVAVGEVVSPSATVEAAERLGYPLVAKAVAAGLVHKTEIGGVIMQIESAAQMAAAVDTLLERCAAHGLLLDAVHLQRQVAGGVEALVGVTSDATFGPLLVCGLGGTLVELTRDVTHHLLPLSDLDAARMLTKLRAARLLDGYRGAPPADRESLVRLMQRVSALALLLPELVEMDLNPVRVLAPGEGAVVVDARMRFEPA